MGQFENTAESGDVSRVEGTGSDSLNLCSISAMGASNSENRISERRDIGNTAEHTLPPLTIDFGENQSNTNADTRTPTASADTGAPTASDSPTAAVNSSDSQGEATPEPVGGSPASHAEAERILGLPASERLDAIQSAIQRAIGESGTVGEGPVQPGAIHWRAAINDLIQNMSNSEVQQLNEAFRNTDPRMQIRDMAPQEQQAHMRLNPGQSYHRILNIYQREPSSGQYNQTDSLPELAQHRTHPG